MQKWNRVYFGMLSEYKIGIHCNERIQKPLTTLTKAFELFILGINNAKFL